MQKFRKILGVCCVLAAIALLAGAARNIRVARQYMMP